MNHETRVFGLPASKGRWIFVMLGLLINVCLGSVYSWSIFRKSIEQHFGIGSTLSGLPYMTFLFFFSLLMPIAGHLLNRYDPRTVAVMGGILVGAGWISAGFSVNVPMLVVCYGMIAGSGVGMTYGTPIAIAAKWFPDKKGLAVGLVVAGFGLSPLLTAPLGKALIDGYGPMGAFIVLGISFLSLLTILTALLRLPPSNWMVTDNLQGNFAGDNTTTTDMLKSPRFYGLWTCYVIGALSGLMAIGIAGVVGEEVIHLPPSLAAMSVALFSVFNGIGRPLFGWLTDKLTVQQTVITSFVLISFSSVAMLGAGKGDHLLYIGCFSLLWLSLGGWLALAPTATARFFGMKHYAKNYGVMFTAYGLGAVLGSILSGRLRDWLGSYVYTFYPTGLLAVVGAVIAWLLLNETKKKDN